MCLAVPARIVEVRQHKAKVDCEGIRRWVGISLVQGLAAGDYVLVHAGEAIMALEEEEAIKTLAVWEEVYAAERRFVANLEHPPLCEGNDT